MRKILGLLIALFMASEAFASLSVMPRYMRWLFSLGGYEYILKIDTGLGDQEQYEKDLQKVSERMRLKIKIPEENWADLQPTNDLYRECKSFLRS